MTDEGYRDDRQAIAEAICVLLNAGFDFDALSQASAGTGFKMVNADEDAAQVVH